MEGFKSQAVRLGPHSSDRSLVLDWLEGSFQRQYPPRQESLLPERQEVWSMSQTSENGFLQSFIHP